MNDTEMFVTIFSGIWGLIGIIFLIIGIAMLKNRKRKEEKCTSKTWGKVKDVVRQRSHNTDGGYSYSWHPVFEYTIGTLTFVKQSFFGSAQSKFAIGQDVEIYYNPDDYNDFYVVEEKFPKTLGKIFIIVGVLGLTVAIVIAIIILNYI